MSTIQLKINKPIGCSGDPHTVTIQTDQNGVPLDRFWRNRLKDAETDNCVEVIKPRTKTTKKEKAK